jgi:hypothetical protein
MKPRAVAASEARRRLWEEAREEQREIRNVFADFSLAIERRCLEEQGFDECLGDFLDATPLARPGCSTRGQRA